MSEYYGVSTPSSDFLAHYGVKGMKWGVRKKQPTSKNIVFISGSSKTQDKQSPYYRRKLPKEMRRDIKRSIKQGDLFLVGDAPGIDRQAQEYLKRKRYDRVEVYGPGTKVRYSANSKWKTHPINDPDHEPMSPEWLAKKDVAMSDRATRGIAVILDKGSSATRNNVDRMLKSRKRMRIFELSGKGPKSLIKGYNPGGDQEIYYWGVHDPKYKIGKGLDYGGHNYAFQYRGHVDRKTRNRL